MKKTVMVHIDGLSNHSLDDRGTRTLLEAARTPHLDDLAQHGELGRLGVPNESRPFVGELALLALLGYDTKKFYSGPGTFESISLEVTLDSHDVAFLCDFVTVRAEEGWGEGKKLGPSLLLDDISAEGLELEDARELLDTINDQLVSENIQFYKGHHSRHLMVWVGGHAKIRSWNPQQVLGQSLGAVLPSGDGAKTLHELMEASRVILQHHPINQERMTAGLKPLNCLWLWGAGKPVEMPLLNERWPITGSVLSPSGSYRGVGIASGLQAATVDDQEEQESEKFQRLAKMAVVGTEKQNFVCLHVPFSKELRPIKESDSSTRYQEYLQCLDEHVIGTLRDFCAGSEDAQLFVVCTSDSRQESQTAKPVVPYVLYDGQNVGEGHSGVAFNEQEAAHHPLRNASTFLARFFGNA